jgi:hypothetical protein
MHMTPEITERMDGWEVETGNGTSLVPCDVVPIPEWLRRDYIIQPGDFNPATFHVWVGLTDALRDYVDGQDIWRIEAITNRYFARLSAPGYLDCTEWCAFKTLREAREYLKEGY